jgi:hypothetical protein
MRGDRIMNSASLVRVSIGVALLAASIVPGCGDGPVDESMTANGGAAGHGAGGKGTAGSAGSKSGGDAGEMGVGGEAGSLGEAGSPSTGGSGGSNGSGGSSGSGGSAGSGGSGGSVTLIKCDACEEQCSNWMGLGLGTDNCLNGPGVAQGGPAESFPLSLLCAELLDCMLRSGCHYGPSGLSEVDCYCGTAGDQCQSGAANGVCREAVEAAAESTDFGDIGARFGSPDYALGRAVIVVQCYDAECPAECMPPLE